MIKEIGKMDSRCTLETCIETVDAQGSVIKEWVSITSAWCEVSSASGVRDMEQEQGNAVAAEEAKTFVIRYQRALDGIGPQDRITWKGWRYNISAIYMEPDGRPTSIKIQARRTAKAGEWLRDEKGRVVRDASGNLINTGAGKIEGLRDDLGNLLRDDQGVIQAV